MLNRELSIMYLRIAIGMAEKNDFERSKKYFKKAFHYADEDKREFILQTLRSYATKQEES